jgi:ACT domain-containing protein
MKAFITVMGRDTVGVIAKVSGLCAELGINVEDVTQSILQGMFAMIMLVDLSGCTVSHDEMHGRFAALGKQMGMQITVTRQEVFDAMHTI